MYAESGELASLPVIAEARGLQSDVECFSWLLETAAAAAVDTD
jgi:hypothetical protein